MEFNKLIFNYLSKGKLTILLFHKIPTEFNTLESSELDLQGFEKILDYTQRIFRILPLEEALISLKKGNLPPRSACITFDDGYSDWAMGAVPVLEKNNAHATFFITTGQFNGSALWNERILSAIANTKKEVLDFKKFGLPDFTLANLKQKELAIQQLNDYIKYQEPDIKNSLLKELEAQLDVKDMQSPFMSKEDVRLIHSKGFGIGAHSETHPILTSCEDWVAYREIAASKEELSSLIRAPINSFAYPNGVPGRDFGLEHIAMLKKAGYMYGLTTHRGAATKETSCWEIPRFTPWDHSRLSIDWQFARNFRTAPYLLENSNQKLENKKVLMIAFHFPPQTGSSGLQRTLNFVKYLPLYGWKPTVVSAHERAFSQCSNDLINTIPQDIDVLRSFALDSARHFAVKRKYPGILAIPDRWSTWWFGGVYSGLKAIKRDSPTVIWSTYPIATAHLIGATLSRITGLPWIADFRDPMINGEYPSPKIQRKSWKWIEARTMNYAARCIFTTERAAQSYKTRYPNASHKCIVIENGYDEEAFSNGKKCLTDAVDENILMLHSGIIYPGDRDPSFFLMAVKDLLLDNKISKNKLKIRFRAPHHEFEILELVKNLQMEDWVEIVPSIPYSEAIEEMQSSSLLLVFQGKNFNTQVPAKIYEYLRAGRSILGLVDLHGDTASKLREFEGVHLANINSVDSIKSEILFWLSQRHSDVAASAIESNLDKIKNFSRKKQTYLLSYIFRSVSKN